MSENPGDSVEGVQWYYKLERILARLPEAECFYPAFKALAVAVLVALFAFWLPQGPGGRGPDFNPTLFLTSV